MFHYIKVLLKVYVLKLFYEIFKDLDNWIHIQKKTRVAPLVFFAPLNVLHKVSTKYRYILLISYLYLYYTQNLQKNQYFYGKFCNYLFLSILTNFV